MDITLLFKACVKTIKTKNRAFGQVPVDNDKARILHCRQSKQEFTIKSREIVQHIMRLHEFLTEHRRAYLNFSNHLARLPQLTDTERDKIDSGAQRIINVCSNFLGDLEKEILIKNEKQGQMFEHQKTVAALLKEYLKQVCKLYSEQRALRIQRTMELRKLIRIDCGSPKRNLSNQDSSGVTLEKKDNYDSDLNCLPYIEDELSVEELQMFELENNELFNELNSMTDEVRQIESKVVRIAELQNIFTEKVLQQDKDMNHVAKMVVGTTENVKEANDQIRQAIQRNAGLRVWILFFLLVMSFSLLFLDWYND
ncbi:hypothetical protein RUM44_005821 [Polyplax serrata]|uniref:SNARE-complex protein Syntaxin-18 N-terminal domain-containing protein n=1 Tax=Polyplax serrata TaxID=468196 RepID=A0ABR1AY85_POLSC